MNGLRAAEKIGEQLPEAAGKVWNTIAAKFRGKPAAENGAHDHGSGHGHAHATFEPVSDCQVLIARGIGQPAYDHAVAHGLQVILTSEKSIGVALEAYRAGHLESDVQRVHPHRD